MGGGVGLSPSYVNGIEGMAGKEGDRMRIGQVVANNVFRKRAARPLTFIEVAVAYVKRESPQNLGTGDGASICSCVNEKIRLI